MYYRTSPGTAQSNETSSPDYISASSWIIFEESQIKQLIAVTLIDDTDPEGPEYFFVNITGTELLRPRYVIEFGEHVWRYVITVVRYRLC